MAIFGYFVDFDNGWWRPVAVRANNGIEAEVLVKEIIKKENPNDYEYATYILKHIIGKTNGIGLQNNTYKCNHCKKQKRAKEFALLSKKICNDCFLENYSCQNCIRECKKSFLKEACCNYVKIPNPIKICQGGGCSPR